MKILFISPFYRPEKISTGKYNDYLGRALIARNVNLTVLCSYPIYPSWKSSRTLEEKDEHRVVRGNFPWYPKAMFFRRLVLEVWFAVFVLRYIFGNRENYDRIVCVIPPSLFAFFVGWLVPADVPIIAVVHDLQGVYASTGEGGGAPLLAKVIGAIEGAVFLRAKKIVALSHEMAAAISDRMHRNCSTIIVRYPFVTVNLDTRSSGDKLSAIMESGRMHIVYSGALGRKQNGARLVALFNYAAAKLEGVSFHIFSGGPHFDALRVSNQVNGSFVKFHGLVREEDLEELILRSSVQVVPQESGTAHGSLPSKLPNLLALGCHVLAICDANAEIARIVSDSRIGTVVERWDEELFFAGLCKALDEVRLRSCETRRELAKPVVKRFSVGRVVDDILFSRDRDPTV